MAKKSKTVNYRKAELIGKEGEVIEETLETLIRRALKSENVPSPVKYSYGIEGQNSYLLLHSMKNKRPYSQNGCLCGCISLYDDETKVSLVDSEYNEEKDEVFNEQVAPVDSNNKLRKLEQQAHYFAIRGDHVAIMAASSKGIDMLKDFFTWLIQDISCIMPTVSVDLVNIPTQNALAMLTEKPVRSISFSSSAYTQHIQPMSDDEIKEIKGKEKGTRKEYVRKIYEEKPVVRAILDAIGCPPVLNAYTSAEDLDGLSVAIEFKCKQRKNESGQNLVRDIARHVGGIEELSPVINLSGKSYISKDMLTVKDTLMVEGDGKNLHRTGAMRSLADWLVEQIESGLV